MILNNFFQKILSEYVSESRGATLCSPMEAQEYWRQPTPSLVDLPNLEIEPRSPALQEAMREDRSPHSFSRSIVDLNAV